MMPIAWQHGITFAHGECFYVEEQHCAHGLQLNFAANTPELITEGIARLYRAIVEVMGN